MYCQDTMQRLNNQVVEKYQAEIAAQTIKLNHDPDYNWVADLEVVICDHCDQPATEAIAVFNPADRLIEVPGAYDLVHICDDCRDNGYLEEDRFWCPGCGELFVTRHSWDSIGCIVEDKEYCQACAIETIQPVTLWQVVSDIENHETDQWPWLTNMPGKEKIWEGEYSSYSNFPGYTDPGRMAGELLLKARETGYPKGSYVYPVITHTYQFSVALAVYAA